MKFIPLRDFDIVTSALNFDTPDCHVTGGCDLYTTKAAGSDKKLYKDIDKSLESQHAALLKLGASLSPPHREEMAASQMLSRSSPFGNLSEISSRRTFAYLIATLNASHPDYDFSHVLRPADFRRERNLRKVMSLIDSTLSNVRPSSLVLDSTLGSSMGGASVGSLPSAASASASPLWGPQMWALINKEMHLQDCTVFSYQPDNNPFDEEDGAIWTMHYFFFSKALKRVAYMYVRGVPLLSHSPVLMPRHPQRRMSHQHHSSIAIAGARSRMAHRRGSRSSRLSSSAADQAGLVGFSTSASSKRPSLSFQNSAASAASDGSNGANKRARYWLGDHYADRLISSPAPGDVVEDEDEEMDEVLLWRPDDDSDVDDYGRTGGDGGFADDDDDISILDSDMDEDEEEDEEDEEEDASSSAAKKDLAQARKQSGRAMSEEIAGRMDIE
ncbi:RNA polymerase III-inhibiting protein maf1 [Sporothrix stenoceras]|uniref:RNA polymerase III-inhibiting protein maf1 n=1 Tax=Sporothrix stenoceras TaxID=5173 RepID=A0ABR3ZG92_9PEZI